MGSRTLPTDCEHGNTVDWGDFGPCQDCSEHALGECPNWTPCEECEREDDEPYRWDDLARAAVSHAERLPWWAVSRRRTWLKFASTIAFNADTVRSARIAPTDVSGRHLSGGES